tara:strand:+ start:274 stop:657 length:384 start_codon:yes stop_codon:yes gene_type:complete
MNDFGFSVAMAGTRARSRSPRATRELTQQLPPTSALLAPKTWQLLSAFILAKRKKENNRSNFDILVELCFIALTQSTEAESLRYCGIASQFAEARCTASELRQAQVQAVSRHRIHQFLLEWNMEEVD